MDNRKYGIIEDLLELTDTEESSSSSSDHGVFEPNERYVLDLHDLVKDEPQKEARQEETRVKKLRKKKKPVKDRTSGTSSSESDSSVPPTAQSKEEFYDAHESYHGLAASAAIMQAVPENGIVMKPTVDQPASAQQQSAPRRDPSTAITKPTLEPQ